MSIFFLKILIFFLFFINIFYIFVKNVKPFNQIKKKMNILDFSTYENIFAIGDIHGEFKRLFNSIRQTASSKRWNLKDAIIFAVGDIGLGFNSINYYEIELSRIDKLLSEKNNHLVLIRGNHDNPDFFEKEILRFNNIHIVSDYTVVLTRNHKTLCVGGAISSDRSWRINQETLINRYKKETSNYKKLYWDNEAFVYDENKLQKIVDSNIVIDSVVTHIYLSLPNMITKSSDYWLETDSTLSFDLEKEKENIQKLYNFLSKKNKLVFWCSGHAHCTNSFLNEDTAFMQLEGYQSIRDIEREISELRMMSEHKSNLEKYASLKGELYNSYNKFAFIKANVNDIGLIKAEEDIDDEEADDLFGIEDTVKAQEPISAELPFVDFAGLQQF